MDSHAALPRIAVTPEQAAIATGRTRTRIFEAIRNNELIAHKDGKATVIETDELKRWVKALPTIGPSTHEADAA